MITPVEPKVSSWIALYLHLFLCTNTSRLHASASDDHEAYSQLSHRTNDRTIIRWVSTITVNLLKRGCGTVDSGALKTISTSELNIGKIAALPELAATVTDGLRACPLCSVFYGIPAMAVSTQFSNSTWGDHSSRNCGTTRSSSHTPYRTSTYRSTNDFANIHYLWRPRKVSPQVIRQALAYHITTQSKRW